MLTVPDQLAVFVYFLYTMQRDAVQDIIVINQIKREMVVRFEKNLAQWYADNMIIKPVIVADDKITLAKFPIPADTIEQFVDWNHPAASRTLRRFLQALFPL